MINMGCLTARATILAVLWAVSLSAPADDRVQEFTYDDAGRLQKAISPEREVTYTLDDAGNRSSVGSTQGYGWPSSISVPELSISGDYTIDWGASTGAGTRYELFEANNPGFANAEKLCESCGLQWPITGKPDGTYYYRVRACDATTPRCGPHRPGRNSILVDRPPVPGVPPSLSVPMYSIDGSIFIYWATSSGTVTAYELYESVNGDSFGGTPVYTGLGEPGQFGYRNFTATGRANGTYAYRLRACNTPYSCSDYRNHLNSTLVTLPPSAPGPISVPAYNNTGSYTVQWSAPPEQMTRFELLEKNLSQETIVYTGMATSHAVSGKPEAVLSYRVRACNGSPGGASACSAYTSEPGTAGVIYIDKVAPTPPTFVSMLGNGYTLYWNGGSSDSAGVGAGSGIDHWNVYRNGALIGTSAAASAGGSFDDNSQPGNITLSYTVRTVDRAGNVSGESIAYTTYRDTIPPTTPGNFRTTSVALDSVGLAWDASTDSSGIARYEITRSPGTTMSTLDASTTYLDQTVASGTAYTYQVVAVDNYSVRSAPATISVTTPVGAPSVPVMNNAGYGVIRARDYTISWQASTGAVAYYVLEEQNQSVPPWVPTVVTGTSKAYTNRLGTFKYRVKACTAGDVCSGYSATRELEVCDNVCN